jgi:hypothetical protein
MCVIIRHYIIKKEREEIEKKKEKKIHIFFSCLAVMRFRSKKSPYCQNTQKGKSRASFRCKNELVEFSIIQ